jgi:two-component system chemotaxis response regulator CheY
MAIRVLLADDLYFMRMPEMNGLEAMRRIFDMDGEARIIICSAIGQQNLILEAINAGIKDFIVKPFNPQRLLSAIRKAVAE